MFIFVFNYQGLEKGWGWGMLVGSLSSIITFYIET